MGGAPGQKHKQRGNFLNIFSDLCHMMLKFGRNIQWAETP